MIALFVLMVCLVSETTSAPSLSPSAPLQCRDGQGQVVGEATETVLDSRLYTIHFDKSDYQTAFVSTLRSNLYRSVDGGKSWSTQLQKMTNAQVVQEPAGYAGVDQVVATADPKKFFFLSYGPRLWTTSTAGERYAEQAAPGGERLDYLLPHPVNADWALGQASTYPCHRGYHPAPGSAPGSPEPCLRSLWLTRDLGATWAKLSDDLCPYSFSWGTAAAPGGGGKWPVWWRRFDRAGVDQGQQDQFATTLVRTDDPLAVARNQALLAHAQAFLVDPSLGFDLAVRYEARNSTGLQFMFSDDRGASWHVARFPSSVADADSYVIVGQTDQVAFTLVRSAAHHSFGTLYASDSLGADWSVSLPFTRITEGAVEFHRMAGIEGIFAANVKRDPLHESDPQANTRVTYDQGASWAPFPATHVRDATAARPGQPPEPVACAGSESAGLPASLRECSLNLHLTYKASQSAQYTQYGPIHSAAQAPGLVLATGDVGPWLGATHRVDTFLSRNAGGDWLKVRNGSHIYEIGDQGGLLAMADDQRPTNSLVWSADVGASWTECTVANTPFDVNNILIESSRQSSVFLVQGTREAADASSDDDGGVNPPFPGARREGVLVHVTLTPHERPCVAADWETWSPSDAAGTPCFQGAKVTYRRRVASAECFHGPDAQVGRQSSTPCACTPDDYRCAFCYRRAGDDTSRGGVCSRIHDAAQGCPDPLPLPDPCTDSYVETNGYEKAPGNQCSPPLTRYAGVSRKCPGSGAPMLSSSAAGTVVGVLLGLVAMGFLVCAVMYKTNDQFNARVAQLRIPGLRGNHAPPPKGQVGSSAFDDGLLADAGGYSSSDDDNDADSDKDDDNDFGL